MSRKPMAVTYYTCSCDWLSKYCDEYHRATARIPLELLEKWRGVDS